MKKNIAEEFDRCYQQYGDKTALIDKDVEITFSQLAARAVGLGSLITRTLDGARNVPVAVLMPKCAGTIISDIAIAYSCNIFMNLDDNLPQARLDNILSRIKPALVITTGRFMTRLENCGIPCLALDEVEPSDQIDETAHAYLMERLVEQIDTDPYCIINTSGSTGTPKGVVLNHRSFFDLHAWAIDTFRFDGSEIMGSLVPAVFDVYVYELNMLMLSGSTIVLLDRGLAAFPVRLLERIAQYKVNYIFWVPTIMVNIANMNLLERVDVSCLKRVWFIGEVFPTKQFNIWRRCLPQASFVNFYGPIEITVGCTYFIVDRDIPDDMPIPIGVPCRNSDILILNEEDKLAGTGEDGELCVRGTSLAMGYYNNPEKTASVFVQNPLNTSYPELIYRTGDIACRNENGEIMFKGRKDTLVKHSGYRIELGEIEHVIVNTLQLVKNCCVVYDYEEKEIVCFYEAPQEITVAHLRREIGTAFPKYMIPNRFIFMPELPRNTNGKIDRLKLKEQVMNKDGAAPLD